MRALLHSFDTTITGFIIRLPAGLRSFFIMVTTLGSPIVTLGIGAVVAVWGMYSANLRLVISGGIVWLTLGLGSIIKLLIGRERPATDYAASMVFDTMSFPSGHSSGAAVAYGLLAYIAWHILPQPWGYIVASIFILLILLIGVSRIYLGAHFPSDVLAGWLLGAAGLCAIIFIVKPFA